MGTITTAETPLLLLFVFFATVFYISNAPYAPPAPRRRRRAEFDANGAPDRAAPQVPWGHE